LVAESGAGIWRDVILLFLGVLLGLGTQLISVSLLAGRPRPSVAVDERVPAGPAPAANGSAPSAPVAAAAPNPHRLALPPVPDL
jgi:hypothetical protein